MRGRSETTGLVPTMGYLHEGHLSLIDAARSRTDRVIVSIFVNPLQFAPGEDLGRYPRDLARDRGLALERGVDAMFHPSVEEMYPASDPVRVVPGTVADMWEGAARPDHFSGVLTVVAKLFHLVEPDVAFFGQKDFQQAVLIRRMVADLNFMVEIVVSPTIREKDGLAMSSRNVYLSPDERKQALALSRALARAHTSWRAGERRARTLEAVMLKEFRVSPAVSVEYIAIVDSRNMEPVMEVTPDTAIAVAARVGQTRLIDNIVMQQGLETWNEDS